MSMVLFIAGVGRFWVRAAFEGDRSNVKNAGRRPALRGEKCKGDVTGRVKSPTRKYGAWGTQRQRPRRLDFLSCGFGCLFYVDGVPGYLPSFLVICGLFGYLSYVVWGRCVPRPS